MRRQLHSESEKRNRMASTIADILRKYGANVTIGTSGQDAIDLLGRQDFDLIFSDIKMPDKTGYDVFAAALPSQR